MRDGAHTREMALYTAPPPEGALRAHSAIGAEYPDGGIIDPAQNSISGRDRQPTAANRSHFAEGKEPCPTVVASSTRSPATSRR